MQISKENLVLYYDSLNNTGTDEHDNNTLTWVDLSGNGNNGAITNAVWTDKYLEFNGSNAWVNCGRQDITAAITIEVLVKYNSITTSGEGNSTVCNFETGGYGIVQENGKYDLEMYISGGYRVLTGSAVQTEHPILLAATFDGSYMRLYENGVEVNSKAQSGTIKTPTNSTVLAIGCNPNGSKFNNNPLNGYVYSVRLYNRALSADEILSNYEYDYDRYFVEKKYYYLLRDGENNVYNIVDGETQLLDTSDLTADLFTTYGSIEPPSNDIMINLQNYQILCWSEREYEKKPKINLSGTPIPQTVVSESIDLSHSSIKGVEKGTFKGEGVLIMAISTDNKQSWIAHNGTEWITLSDEFSGMSQEQLESITVDQWSEVITEDVTHIHVRVVLNSFEQSVTEIYLDFVN